MDRLFNVKGKVVVITGGGGVIFHISNPAMGLWSWKERFG